jgi:DNA-binding PadR family transcriptional regulator
MSDDPNLVERDSRRRLLAEIGGERLSSHEIAVRLAGDGREPTAPEAEASLLPELHRLESDGKLRAGWEPSSAGKVRRRYRTR